MPLLYIFAMGTKTARSERGACLFKNTTISWFSQWLLGKKNTRRELRRVRCFADCRAGQFCMAGITIWLPSQKGVPCVARFLVVGRSLTTGIMSPSALRSSPISAVQMTVFPRYWPKSLASRRAGTFCARRLSCSARVETPRRIGFADFGTGTSTRCIIISSLVPLTPLA